jgi:hypothetical protein
MVFLDKDRTIDNALNILLVLMYHHHKLLDSIFNIVIFLGSKARPARKADNLTAIFEPIVKVMWDP